jgi:hypothetical protein
LYKPRIYRLTQVRDLLSVVYKHQAKWSLGSHYERLRRICLSWFAPLMQSHLARLHSSTRFRPDHS